MLRRNVIRIAALSLTALSPVACGEKQIVTPAAPPIALPKVVSISLSLSDSLVLVAQPVTVTAVARDSAGSTPVGRTLRWTSSDTAVAIVSASGVITGRGVGLATIAAEADGTTASLPIAVAFGVPAALVVPGADTLNTIAGTTNIDLPTVFVVDQTGRPVPGIAVSARADSGAGTITLASARTDANGGVAVRQWTLGTRAGRYRVVISAKALSLELFMRVRPDVPATMTLVSGDDQAAAPGALVAEPLVVRVNDRFSNAVPGVSITFESNGDDVGTLTPFTAVTDTGGRARTLWRLPTRAPSQASVRIRASGLPSLIARALILGFTAKQVAVGLDHTCAIDLGDRVWCWGYNGFDELGVSSVTTPRSAKPIPLPTSLRFVSISAADWATCGIATDGQTYCWGSNATGALGDPVPAQRRGIGPLVAPRFAQIAMQVFGPNCGVTADGQLHCWPLGSAWAPQRVTMPESITETLGRACSLGVSRTVYCWSNATCLLEFVGGRCYYLTSHTTPMRVSTPEPIARLATGSESWPCVISVTSKLYCKRITPTRGDTASITLDQLVTLDGPVVDAAHVSSGGTCAVTSSGALYCWGPYNAYGSLGTGDDQPRATPTEITKGRFVAKRVAASFLTTCAIDKYSQVWCWGARVEGLTYSAGGPPVLSPTLVAP